MIRARLRPDARHSAGSWEKTGHLIVRTAVFKSDKDGIRQAAAVLRKGGLVAFPTETVFGLGADAGNADAVAKIYAAKGRPPANPLIVHVASLREAEQIVAFNADARRLAGAFWPGPLTLVLPMRPDAGVAANVAAGLQTLGVRIPSHSVARRLLREFGGPVAAPSANRSNKVSPTRTAHVLRDLDGAIDSLLDGGDCQLGLESTILAPSGGRLILLRHGAVSIEKIQQAADILPRIRSGSGVPASPGQLPVHYAPDTELRLAAENKVSDEILIGFGPGWVHADLNLSPKGDLDEAASNLFAMLRLADDLAIKSNRARIAVASVPDQGIGHSINDRLLRAARAPTPD